jgi:DNA-binding MarR family transcriptional regulator
MRFDPIVTNPGRLTILTALLDDAQQDFVTLRKQTCMTDGNLTTHARKLATAGLVRIDKTTRQGRPVTYITLTEQGRHAFTRHVSDLMQRAQQPIAAPVMEQAAVEEVWID